jgi:hypothetical protein
VFLEKRESGFVEDFEYIVHPLGLGWRIPANIVMWDASMRRYRQTDIFKSYVRESGIFDYWQQVGYPPQCRPAGDDDFKCD